MNHSGREQNDVSNNKDSLDVMGQRSLHRNNASRQTGYDQHKYRNIQHTQRPPRSPEGSRIPTSSAAGRKQSAPGSRRPQNASGQSERPHSQSRERNERQSAPVRDVPRNQRSPQRPRPSEDPRRRQAASDLQRLSQERQARRPQQAPSASRPSSQRQSAPRPSAQNQSAPRQSAQRQSAPRRSNVSNNYFRGEEQYYDTPRSRQQKRYEYGDYDLTQDLSGIGSYGADRLNRSAQRNQRRRSRPDASFDDAAYAHEDHGASASARKSMSGSGNGNHPSKHSRNVFGTVLVILQGILSVVFAIALKILDILPMKFYIPVIAALVLLFGFVLFTQLKKRKKALSIVGKVLSVILCLALGVGNYYLIITNNALEKVTGDTAGSVIYMDVAVLSSDPAKNIKDAADYTFGTNAIVQPKNLNTALQEIESDIGKRPKTNDYTSAMEQIDALFAKEVGAIIYNRDFKKTMEEKYTTLDNDIRIIKTVKISIESDIKSGSTVDVTKDPFLVYISGNDELGPVSAEGRTDVNMLLAVNPNTHQVLMINTPRDYFVELPGFSQGKRDKLTHSGIYGMQCQIDTMNAIYGYDIDFYFKINFSSLIEIVDALGGIDLYNDYEFAFTYSDTVFEKGNIHLDGWQALEYCRERKNLESGDEDRGRHQQIVIEAIMNKLLSSSGIAAYNQMIATLEKCCITNMPKESISALVKKQLDEGGGWTVSKSGSQGEGMIQITYSMPDTGLFVVMPYVESIQNMQQMLGELYAGDEITVRGILDPDTDKLTLVAQPEPLPDESGDSGDSGSDGGEEDSENDENGENNGDEG